MTFISYAQNFEDVMLWRGLKHIENGFYIDVGAWWPETDSVTKAFYNHGWSGINIEPDFTAYSRLICERPRDINLRIAISDYNGGADIYIIKGTGLSTLRNDIAEKHLDEGYVETKIRTEVRTLKDIWKDYVPPNKDVCFLKVDTEGLEKEVLMGNDWSKYRPWIVLVEANLPNSQQEAHEAWENILTTADYLLAFKDGLNRFYVASEHRELLQAFEYPPNFFDGFKLNAQKRAEEKADECIEKLSDEIAIVRDQSDQLLERERLRSQMIQRELQSLHTSRCWRITAPLRAGFDLLLRAKATLLRFANAHPSLKDRAVSLVRRYPGNVARPKVLIGDTPEQISIPLPLPTSDLSPQARRICADLKNAIERNRRRN